LRPFFDPSATIQHAIRRTVQRTIRRSILSGLASIAALGLSASLSHGVLANTLDSPAEYLEASAAPAVETLASTAYPSLLTELEAELFAHTNADRIARGLEPLTWDPDLLDVARTRAATQVPLPSLSHNDATGQLAVGKLLASRQVTYQLAGENLARLPGAGESTASRAEVALMNSPLHRKNILEPRFNRLAIGAVTDPNGRVIYAQIFRAA